MIAQYLFHCSEVIVIGAESLGIIRLIATISSKSSLVEISEFGSAWFVLSRTALDAGVFATYPKLLKSLPLHMGASLASMYCLSWTSLNIASSTVSLDVDSKTNP
jgi:hypothetical protein